MLKESVILFEKVCIHNFNFGILWYIINIISKEYKFEKSVLHFYSILKDVTHYDFLKV